ncbi:MAG: hypothetical protein J5712_03025 [Lachnospiraceae bacterium]|nr:hypothetical protein [Lachnospiraceae bacterium]MBO4559032.1 hypothetical protein [Lachnospiraceae bacterium]MBR5732682.1 hypothetical protein [Lachnospiraceae bacterium]
MMKEETFKKVRRIAAIVAIVLLVGMYIVAIVAALGKSENAQAIFKLALYCTFVVPVIIYLLQLVYKLANKKNEEK